MSQPRSGGLDGPQSEHFFQELRALTAASRLVCWTRPVGSKSTTCGPSDPVVKQLTPSTVEEIPTVRTKRGGRIKWHAFRIARSIMQILKETRNTSWLSLVAETAGVKGATIARIELRALVESHRLVRAIVQIHGRQGAVLGATSWEGDARELEEGVQLDFGCDLETSLGTSVVGWIDQSLLPLDVQEAKAPFDAQVRHFDPTRAMKLMLRGQGLEPSLVAA